MSTVNQHLTACPECNQPDTIALESGNWFCLSCRTEWNPANVQPKPTPPVEVVADPTADAIPGVDFDIAVCDICGRSDPHDHPEETSDLIDRAESEAFIDALIGTRVLLEGGQWATLVGFPDDDHAEVILDADAPSLSQGERSAIFDQSHWIDYPRTVVDFNSIMRGDPLPEPDPPAPVDQLDAAQAEAMGAAVTAMACTIIEAGCATLREVDGERVLGDTPLGWLPDDAEALPLIEQACAVAVAMLMQAWNLPMEQTLSSVAKVKAQNTEPTSDTEGGNAEN